MANTTWNPSDKTASITLSGSNLTATASTTNQGVRATDKQIAGKWYFEVTLTTSATQSGVGVARVGAPLASGGTPTGAVMVAHGASGLIFLNGVSTGIGIGNVGSGSLVGMAVDLDASQIWFRLGAAGNWNGNAGNAPNTGVGGVSFVSIGGIAVPVYPVAYLNGNGVACTANFGDTAFTGTVPAGFTSGFTAGASVPTSALATQVAVEQWASISAGSNLALVTQVALEEWAVISAAAARQNAVTVISG